jgi:cell division protein ZapD
MLRLEDLYQRATFFIEKDTAFEHHSALLTLFELMEAANRSDLKSDLLQELEKQRQSLQLLRNDPQISETALDDILNNIRETSAKLLSSSSKFAQHIRDNEWLMVIKQRAIVPGGTSRFDIPSYFYWQNKPVEERRNDLNQWFAPMQAIQKGINILLYMLRNSAQSTTYNAHKGQYQEISGGKPMQLVRLSLSKAITCVPELSANRYAINVRFMIPDITGVRPVQTTQDVEFIMSYCNFQ